MRRIHNPISSVQTRGTVAPTGVTLSEVLVSMLIMSVGVVSLATLFPISVLRTAQATQLTHSVFLRNNAEAAVELNAGLLSNKQIYGVSGLGIIDPLGVQLVGMPTAPYGPFWVGVGTSLGGVRRTDGLALTSSITPAQRLALAEQLATLPDSWSLVREEAVTATNLGGSPPTITVGNSTSGLYVRNSYMATSTTTSNMSQAPHRMVMFDATGKLAVLQPLHQVQQIPPYTLSWWNVNGSGASLATGPSLPAGFIPTRVRIEVQDRRYTWMMTVRKEWIGQATGLDGADGVDDDNNGTIDDPDGSERHYSGTDDDQNWDAKLDVAVFYNRSFLPAQTPAKAGDETAHTLTYPVSINAAADYSTGVWTGFDGKPGVSGVDDDNDGTTDIDPGESHFPGSDDNRTVLVTYAAGSTPYLKKGSYLLLSQLIAGVPTQLKWYRILDLKDGLAANTTVLLLDLNLRYPATPAATVTAQGIFLKGIVEVYSLGSRTGQQ